MLATKAIGHMLKRLGFSNRVRNRCWESSFREWSREETPIRFQRLCKVESEHDRDICQFGPHEYQLCPPRRFAPPVLDGIGGAGARPACQSMLEDRKLQLELPSAEPTALRYARQGRYCFAWRWTSSLEWLPPMFRDWRQRAPLCSPIAAPPIPACHLRTWNQVSTASRTNLLVQKRRPLSRGAHQIRKATSCWCCPKRDSLRTFWWLIRAQELRARIAPRPSGKELRRRRQTE